RPVERAGPGVLGQLGEGREERLRLVRAARRPELARARLERREALVGGGLASGALLALRPGAEPRPRPDRDRHPDERDRPAGDRAALASERGPELVER